MTPSLFLFRVMNVGQFASSVFTYIAVTRPIFRISLRARTEIFASFHTLYTCMDSAIRLTCHSRHSFSTLASFCLNIRPSSFPLSLTACRRRPYKNSATANFGFLVSLYGDERRSLAPPWNCERGACTNRRRRSPFASIFGSEFDKNRKEGRAGERRGERMDDEDFPPTLETRSASGWEMNVGH